MGPVSSFRDNILPLVTVEVTGVQPQGAVLVGLTWPPTVPVRLGIPGTVSARPGGCPITPHCWPPRQVAFGRPWGCGPPLLGLDILGGGHVLGGLRPPLRRTPPAWKGAVPGPWGRSVISQSAHSSQGPQSGFRRMDAEDVCGGSCPDPSLDPSSALPGFLGLLGDHWWVPAGSVSGESGELGWQL